MRYQIVARTGNDRRVIYDTASPLKGLALIDPKLHLEADNAGTFECTVPPDNICYKLRSDGSSMIQEMLTEIIIIRVDKQRIIWKGRVSSFNSDFNNMPSIYAEGHMSYFNDRCQTPRTFNKAIAPSLAPNTILADILNYYNEPYETATGSPRIVIGNVVGISEDILDISPFVVEYETTFSTLSRLRSTYGGHFRIRYEGMSEIGYLDWFGTYDTTMDLDVAQHINFGKNLLDFTRESSGVSVLNAVMPFGKTIYSSGNVAIGEKIPIMDPSKSWGGPDAEGNYLAWGNGYRIISANNTYEYQAEESNSATGYWDANSSTDRGKSLRVYPGEVYYINSFATASTTMYIVTQGKMGQNGTYVRAVRNANSNWNEGTQLKFQKITIPDLKYDDGCGANEMYLNLSALKQHITIYETDTDEVLNMSIYKSRVIEDGHTEKITLNGLDNGVFDNNTTKYYLDTEHNILITPQGIADGWYIYPNTLSISTDYIMPRSDFPENGQVGQHYLDSDTGLIYLYQGTSQSTYDYVLTRMWKGYYKEGLYILDKESISKYGRFEKMIELSDVTNPSDLKAYGLYYLSTGNTENIKIDISAVDIEIVDPETEFESPNVLDPIVVKSSFHGINMVLPLQQRDIPFNDLASQTFSLGYEKTQRLTDSFPHN